MKERNPKSIRIEDSLVYCEMDGRVKMEISSTFPIGQI